MRLTRMREIQLTKGLVAVVDDEDYDALAEFEWQAIRSSQKLENFYARRGLTRGERPSCIYMHRQILSVPMGVFVDHINGDGLFNVRPNLRICSPRQNAMNR